MIMSPREGPIRTNYPQLQPACAPPSNPNLPPLHSLAVNVKPLAAG